MSSIKKPGCILLSVLVAGGIVSCGGAAFEAGVKWDPKETRFFDDGVDIIEDLSNLSGAYGYEQSTEFDGRAQLADFIAEVRVLSMQVSKKREGGEARRMDVIVQKVYYGTSPQDRFFIESDKESQGHQLLIRHEERLFEDTFVLFIRWFDKRDDEGNKTLGHHFHLSPFSDSIKEALEKTIKERIREEEVAAAAR
jgi:hypothetical protein